MEVFDGDELVYTHNNPTTVGGETGHRINIDVPGCSVQGDRVRISIPGKGKYLWLVEVVVYGSSVSPTESPTPSPTTLPRLRPQTLQHLNLAMMCLPLILL